MKRYAPWILGGALVLALAIAVASIVGYLGAKDRYNQAVEDNNRLAAEDTVRSIELSDSIQVLNEVRSFLARSEGEALRLAGENEALDQKNRELGRKLQTAIQATAEIEAEFDSATAVLASIENDTLRLEASDDLVEVGGAIAYDLDAAVPLLDPESARIRLRLTGSFVVDTRVVWEDSVPICQTTARVSFVEVRPGRCVVNLERTPIAPPSFRVTVPTYVAVGVPILTFLAGLLIP